MRANKTSPWFGCFGLAIAMSPQTAVAQEMTKADMEQMQRLVGPMGQANDRLRPILLISAHVGACLTAYVNDLNAGQVATLKQFDELVDDAGRTEMSSLVSEALPDSRADVAAFMMGYSLGMGMGARNQVPELGDCLDTIKSFEAKKTKPPG